MKDLLTQLQELHARQEATEEQIQRVLATIVDTEGHGPFTFHGESFTIARNGAKWRTRKYKGAEAKVIE